ncbi:MAG: hypothetical protein Q4E06_02640 [Lautropia sp.]|nr:hypothetical protein [Lautropia sp.]
MMPDYGWAVVVRARRDPAVHHRCACARRGADVMPVHAADNQVVSVLMDGLHGVIGPNVHGHVAHVLRASDMEY